MFALHSHDEYSSSATDDIIEDTLYQTSDENITTSLFTFFLSIPVLIGFLFLFCRGAPRTF